MVPGEMRLHFSLQLTLLLRRLLDPKWCHWLAGIIGKSYDAHIKAIDGSNMLWCLSVMK